MLVDWKCTGSGCSWIGSVKGLGVSGLEAYRVWVLVDWKRVPVKFAVLNQFIYVFIVITDFKFVGESPFFF